MSVNEIQALAQKFADAFDRRDIKAVLDMLSDDVEVFDTVPYRRSRRQASFCASFTNEGFRGYLLNKLRLSAAILTHLQRYGGDSECLRHVQGCHQGRQTDSRRWPNNSDLCQTGHAMEDCKLRTSRTCLIRPEGAKRACGKQHADRKGGV